MEVNLSTCSHLGLTSTLGIQITSGLTHNQFILGINI